MLSTSVKCALIALFGCSFHLNTALATPSATGSYVAATTGVMKSLGCYSSAGDMTDEGTYEWQSSANCESTCLKLSKPVLGLQNGGHCWCGDSLPPNDSNVALSECNVGCYGYGEPCGGKTTWTVWLTGFSAEVPIYGSSDSSSSASAAISSLSTTSAAFSSISSTNRYSSTADSSSSIVVSSAAASSPSPSPSSSTSSMAVAETVASSSTTSPATSADAVTSSVVQATIVQIQTVTVGGSVKTVMGTTVVASTIAVTPGSSLNNQQPSGSGSNKAGIAAGVVVGVIALLGVVGGVVYYLKRRSKKAKASTHRRQTSLDAFVGAAGRNQAIAGGVRASTMNDSRLDPRIMVERRQSEGSLFADNVDYSRRILKVANPDDS